MPLNYIPKSLGYYSADPKQRRHQDYVEKYNWYAKVNYLKKNNYDYIDEDLLKTVCVTPQEYEKLYYLMKICVNIYKINKLKVENAQLLVHHQTQITTSYDGTITIKQPSINLDGIF